VFRRLIKRLGGCGLVMTEFTSAEGLTRNSLKSKRMLFYHEEERPVTAQLFGAEPSRLAEATRMVEDLGFDAIDLNLGCPAKKVVKACGGSALLRETKLLEDILKTIRDATDKPIRVDANAGWSVARAKEMIPKLRECGVEFLEQPLVPEDLDGLSDVRRVAAAHQLPIVVDESCLVAADIPRLVGRADGINIKLAKCGSLREALRMIATARALGMLVMVGCMIETSLGITAAAHFTPLVDAADLDGAALTVDDPFTGATIERGQIRLPTEPGLGVKRK